MTAQAQAPAAAFEDAVQDKMRELRTDRANAIRHVDPNLLEMARHATRPARAPIDQRIAAFDGAIELVMNQDRSLSRAAAARAVDPALAKAALNAQIEEIMRNRRQAGSVDARIAAFENAIEKKLLQLGTTDIAEAVRRVRAERSDLDRDAREAREGTSLPIGSVKLALDLLAAERQREAAKAASAWTRYVSLLRRVDKADSADAAKLAALLKELGISGSEAMADVATIRQAQTYLDEVDAGEDRASRVWLLTLLKRNRPELFDDSDPPRPVAD